MVSNSKCVEWAAADLASKVVDFLAKTPGKPGKTLERMEEALFRYHELRIHGTKCGDPRCCAGAK